MNTLPDDLEVDLTNESVKAIVRGKTGVPFKTFVKLILQRKVTVLFENGVKTQLLSIANC